MTRLLPFTTNVNAVHFITSRKTESLRYQATSHVSSVSKSRLAEVTRSVVFAPRCQTPQPMLTARACRLLVPWVRHSKNEIVLRPFYLSVAITMKRQRQSTLSFFFKKKKLDDERYCVGFIRLLSIRLREGEPSLLVTN